MQSQTIFSIFGFPTSQSRKYPLVEPETRR